MQVGVIVVLVLVVIVVVRDVMGEEVMVDVIEDTVVEVDVVEDDLMEDDVVEEPVLEEPVVEDFVREADVVEDAGVLADEQVPDELMLELQVYHSGLGFGRLLLNLKEWLSVAPMSQLDDKILSIPVLAAVGDHQTSVPSHGHT